MASSWSGRRTGFSSAQRRKILQRDPVCVMCHAAESTIADHVVCYPEAMRRGWSLAEYHDWRANGQGLCGSCHDRKTKAEQVEGLRRFGAKRWRPAGPHPGLIDG